MTKSIKWAATALLVLLTLLVLSPMALAADPYAGYKRVDITTLGEVALWNDIGTAIGNAQGPTYITIDQNIWLSDDRFSFFIVSGKDIVIDMKGHTLLAWSYKHKTSYSGVFNVEKGAKLKLINGEIRRITYYMDAQAIRNYGDMTLENWSIDDIISPSSGGAIQNNGTMVIRGGKITNCHSQLWSDGSGKHYGGAIFNKAGATLTIDGTEIKGNECQLDGGAIYNEGTLTITGKTNIHDNKASRLGGGVCLADSVDARLYLNGGTIQNNSCGTDGGGVYVPNKASLHVSGDPVVSGNWQGTGANKAGNNLKLIGNARIQVDGALTDGAKLGVTLDFERGVITQGYGAGNSAEPKTFFEPDRGAPFAIIKRSGEAAVDKVADGVSYIDRGWNGRSVTEVSKTTDDGTVCFPNSATIEPGWYCVTEDVTVNGRVSLKGDTHIVLCDGHFLNVKGLYIPQGSTLHIYGQQNDSGRLVSKPTAGAGIGAYSGHKGGNVVIHGGSVEAKGYDHCAGIGSNDGDLKSVGSFTMYGGTVKAGGGGSGAGIGGGRASEGGSITIYGGDVTATGGHYGAGIGGGNGQDNPVKGAHGGTITIWGGRITATGGDDGAGIGGGEGGNAGTIVINGGTVTATGGNNSAGIGCGEGEGTGRGGSVTINGGTVTANGGKEGAGIGSGEDGWIDSITINGGMVTANGGRLAAAIGGGNNVNSGTITITAGTVTANRNSDNGFGIGSGDDCDGSTIISLGLAQPNGNDICVTASSFNGKVTLNQAFEIGGRKLDSGAVTDNRTLIGGMLVGTKSKPHDHDNLSFHAWNSANSLPAEPGEYYLTRDVTLKGDGWSWNGGAISLCLNGHTIKGDQIDDPVLNIVGGSLDLYDEKDGLVTQYDGRSATVRVGGSAAFTQHGGTISGAMDSFAGVDVYGVFHMAGGAVTGNDHGVELGDHGTFRVSGDVRVTGNKRDVLMMQGERIGIVGALSRDSRIGILDGDGVFTQGLPDNGTIDNFFSGFKDESIMIGLSEEGEAVLGKRVTVTFDPGDEAVAADMEKVTAVAGTAITLPECGFTAPEGVAFAGWLVGGETLRAGDNVTMTEDVTVAAQWQSLNVADALSVTVTLEVVNGAWDDETREPRIIVLTGNPGDALRLDADDLPNVGDSPDEGYETGDWDVEPPIHSESLDLISGDPITEDVTYTYIYKPIGAEEPAEEPAGASAEQPAGEPADKPAEQSVDQSAEKSAEQSAEQSGEQPADKPVEQPVEQSADKPAEQPVDKPVEQPADKPAEQSAEQSVEQPVDKPVEQPAEQSVEGAAQQPIQARVCEITFDGGGADGEMSPAQVNAGSEFTMPACDYYIDGCTFDTWMVQGAGQPFACRPGDRITVDSDLTVVACWLFEEVAVGNQAEDPENPDAGNDEGAQAAPDSPGGGLDIVYDDMPEAGSSGEGLDIVGGDIAVDSDPGADVPGADIPGAEEDLPSEVGSVFSGAGIAAIIAAALLALAAVGIAVARKKKR